MGKSKKSEYWNRKAFLSGLQNLLKSLPTEAEKKEMQAQLGELVTFLTDLKNNAASLPSSEDSESVSRAIQQLDAALAKAQENPVVSKALGLSRPKAARPTLAPPSQDQLEKARSELQRLETLPVDDIRSKLSSDDYSVQELMAIAHNLGIRHSKSPGRDSLAHQIAMKIANFRGYQQLSGQDKPT